MADRLAGAVRHPVQEAFKGYFKDMLIPAFELSCQKMFQQISTTFDHGLQQSMFIAPLCHQSSLCCVTAFEGIPRGTALAGGEGRSADPAAVSQMGNAVQTLVDIAAALNHSIIDTQQQILNRIGDPDGRRTSPRRDDPLGLLYHQPDASSLGQDPCAELEALLGQERYEFAFTQVDNSPYWSLLNPVPFPVGLTCTQS